MTDPQPTPWYRDWFDEVYLDLYQHRDTTEAAAFLEVLRARYGDRGERGVADIACGAGRHAWVMAGEFGWPVVGVDLSMPLLRRAIAEPTASHSTPPRFVRGDIRALPLGSGSVGLAVNLFTSFGYFDSDDDHQLVLHEMRRVLDRDGLLVIDLLNPQPALARLVAEDESTVGRWHVRQQREYHATDQRIVKTITLTDEQGTRRTVRESVRLFAPEQLDPMLHTAGLAVRERWGGYDGLPWNSTTSSRLITIAEPRS